MLIYKGHTIGTDGITPHIGANGKWFVGDADTNVPACPNIQVGEIETLMAGSDATVTRQPGSPDAAPVLNFGIPRGADAISLSTPAFSFYLQNNHLMMRYVSDENAPIPTPNIGADGHLYLTYTLKEANT